MNFFEIAKCSTCRLCGQVTKISTGFLKPPAIPKETAGKETGEKPKSISSSAVPAKFSFLHSLSSTNNNPLKTSKVTGLSSLVPTFKGDFISFKESANDSIKPTEKVDLIELERMNKKKKRKFQSEK